MALSMRRSPIYSHIWVYRGAMNVLYRGEYRRRFEDVVRLLGPGVQSVCELCFGDTVVAEWCRTNGIRWTGIDINHGFCRRARRHGFDVIEGDVLAVDLTQADVFLMAGSLYHFPSRLSELFDVIFRHTDRFILSEPVHNMSSRTGLVGWCAKRAGNAGTGDRGFRFDPTSLTEALERQQRRKGLELRVVSVNRDMLVEMTRDPCSSR